MIEWQWYTFSNLTPFDIYQIAKARQDIFINEQKCFYSDLDDIDQTAWHLVAWKSNTTNNHSDNITGKKLIAYLRVLSPNVQCKEVNLGRFLVIKKERGGGIGKKMLVTALEKIKTIYPERTIKIAAQTHLQGFYGSFGFKALSDPYDEDGVMHIDMVKP